MHTVCLRSTDATVLSEGVYRWDVLAENARRQASRVMLASIELPMSQWSIEEEWSRVYLTERLRIEPRRRLVSVQVEGDDGKRSHATAALPLHLNRLTSVEVVGGCVVVHTEHPHGLSPAALAWITGNEAHAKIVGAAVGPIDVSTAWREQRLEIKDAHVFEVTPQHGPPEVLAVESKGGHLYFPSPPSPDALARLLTATLQQGIAVAFDKDQCRFRLTLAAYPEGATMVRMSVGGDALASLMGLSGASHSFTRYAPSARTAGYASSAESRAFLDSHVTTSVARIAGVGGAAVGMGGAAVDAPPLTIVADASALFGYVTLRPGWYAPSQRVYSTCPPLRAPSEWALQFARFMFPASEDGKQLGVVFTDPRGVDRIVEIASGLYTAQSICDYLTAMMNLAPDGARVAPSFQFSVKFRDGRFSFACHTPRDGVDLGLAFALHFDRPRSVSAARFGFADGAALEGSDAYESSHVVAEASTPFGRMHNLYELSEVAGQRKFSIRPRAPIGVMCIAENYERGVLKMRCVTPDAKSVSHGIEAGRVVTLSAAGFVEGAAARHEPILLDASTLCVVARGVENRGVTTIDVEIPATPWVLEAVREHKAMRMTCAVEPCSFCFCDRLRHTIGGERLGFPDATLQWGLDGAVRTRQLRVPPFLSPESHNLDHVDFLLLRLREGKASVLTQCQSRGQSIDVFGKVCLNPVFRNERHLPVELALTGSDRLDAVTIEVLNPDLTPYHFHGATWSLSLGFLT